MSEENRSGILKRGADCVISLKGNQSTMHDEKLVQAMLAA